MLDPVAPDEHARFLELARDVEGHAGKITDGSRCEARLSLTLEAQGVLASNVARPAEGDVEDGRGQVWDYKSPRSRSAILENIQRKARRDGNPLPTVNENAYRGEFDLDFEVERAIAQQMKGKGVVFDVRRLTYHQAKDLIASVTAEGEIDQDLIIFYPDAQALERFSL